MSQPLTERDRLLATRRRRFNQGTAIITPVSDSFNRGDDAGSLGVSDSGHTWEIVGQPFGIQTNRAYCPAPTGVSQSDYAVIDAGGSNGIVKVTFAVVASAGMGLVARFKDANNSIYALHTGTAWTMWRRVNGTSFLVASTTLGISNGDIPELILNGPQISLKVNDVQRISPQYVGEHLTATKHGIFVFNSATPRFDVFSATGL